MTELNRTSHTVLNKTSEILAGVSACSCCCFAMKALNPSTADSEIRCIDPERSRRKAISVHCSAVFMVVVLVVVGSGRRMPPGVWHFTVCLFRSLFRVEGFVKRVF